MLAGHLPRRLRSYSRADLGHDVVAGIVLSALLVPTGMAYAQASGLPAVHGLYATIVPLVVYALIGPSRILVVGPDSTLTPLVLAAIVPLSVGANSPDQRIALASTLAILAGAIGLAASLLRMGFVADLLSAPIRVGYVNGIVLTILAGQLPVVFGLEVASTDVVPRLADVASGLVGGDATGWPTAIGLGCTAALVVLPRYTPNVPASLVVVVASIAVVVIVGLGPDDLALVGDLPRGLPAPVWPDVSFDDALGLIGAAAGIAFVAFADTAVLSRVLSVRRGEAVDPDRELAAIGAVNMAAGVFQGFPVSASSSRTPAAEAAGARTQMTGLVGAVTVAILIVVSPDAFRNLPRSALAAVVVMAAIRLIDISTLRRLARVRRSDLVLSVLTFMSVAVLGPIAGVGVAVGLSLLDVMRRSWRPHATRLVRVDGVKGYHDVERHPEGRTVPGLVLYRFDAPLYFANAGHFAREVRRLTGLDVGHGDAHARAPEGRARWIVVTAEPITDVDTSAAEELERLIGDLERAGVTFAFAELKGHVRDQLERYDLAQRIGADRFYRTVGEAVRAYVTETGVDWTDWEDAPP